MPFLCRNIYFWQRIFPLLAKKILMFGRDWGKVLSQSLSSEQRTLQNKGFDAKNCTKVTLSHRGPLTWRECNKLRNTIRRGHTRTGLPNSRWLCRTFHSSSPSRFCSSSASLQTACWRRRVSLSFKSDLTTKRCCLQTNKQRDRICLKKVAQMHAKGIQHPDYLGYSSCWFKPKGLANDSET